MDGSMRMITVEDASGTLLARNLDLLRELSFPLSRKVYWLGGDYCIYSDTLGGVIDGRKEPFFITIGQD